MWEFSLNLKAENMDLAKQIYYSLFKYIKENKGVITLHEDDSFVRIIVAVDHTCTEKLKSLIASCIIEIICNNFKLSFLNKNLILPDHDKLGMTAFKKALLNFDKETDKFIIKKNLDLSKDIFLESFYQFKLKSLKEKWAELVALSNENREYLVSSDSFIDLLKFLVDNLDICENEISIVKESEGYRIFSSDNIPEENKLLTEELVVSSVIDLSPQRINLYFNETSKAITLLEKIFEERIIINDSLQNIKNFKLK